MIEPTIRAVVYREGEWWVVQFLEYDLSTATRRLEDLPEQIRRFLLIHFAACRDLGVEPFHGFQAAPARYWRMYDEATAWGEPVTKLDLPPEFALDTRVETRLAA